MRQRELGLPPMRPWLDSPGHCVPCARSRTPPSFASLLLRPSPLWIVVDDYISSTFLATQTESIGVTYDCQRCVLIPKELGDIYPGLLQRQRCAGLCRQSLAHSFPGRLQHASRALLSRAPVSSSFFPSFPLSPSLTESLPCEAVVVQ